MDNIRHHPPTHQTQHHPITPHHPAQHHLAKPIPIHPPKRLSAVSNEKAHADHDSKQREAKANQKREKESQEKREHEEHQRQQIAKNAAATLELDKEDDKRKKAEWQKHKDGKPLAGLKRTISNLIKSKKTKTPKAK